MYRQPLEAASGVLGCIGDRGDIDGGCDRGIEVRKLNDGEGFEGGGGAGEERVVAQVPEDLEEEGEPIPERPPHLERPPRGVHLGMSQLGHLKDDSGG